MSSFFSGRRLKLQEPCHTTAHLLNRTVLIYDVSLKIVRLKLRLQEMSSINHNFTYLLTCAAGRCLGWRCRLSVGGSMCFEVMFVCSQTGRKGAVQDGRRCSRRMWLSVRGTVLTCGYYVYMCTRRVCGCKACQRPLAALHGRN